MAIAVKTGTQTAADELRTVLAQSEDLVVKLGGREAAEELYSGMDRLAELWPVIQEIGVDVRRVNSMEVAAGAAEYARRQSSGRLGRQSGVGKCTLCCGTRTKPLVVVA